MVYIIIDKIFSKSDVEFTASEAHGIATGMLCADENAESVLWLDELFKNAKPVNEEGKNLLIRLFDETSRLLKSDGFEFELLLPEDDRPLNEQVEALRTWSQGFLFGISFSETMAEWPEDVNEIVKDVTEFTKLESKVGSEEDENAFAEIVEYLRSAVCLLRDDVNDLLHSPEVSSAK